METLNTIFEKIYCINLDRRPEKYIQYLDEAKKHNITGTIRYPAIDGANITNFTSGKINNGELGCLLSHLNILNEIVANNYQRTLILEDDVEFHDNLNSLFSEYIQQPPPNWDMLYLGGSHHSKNVEFTKNVHRIYQTYTTSSYAITLEAAKKLIPMVKKANIQVDVIYSDFQKTNNCYAFMPPLAWQRTGYSDIQNMWCEYKQLK